MHKRYLRIDFEYDMDINPILLQSYVILNNVKKIINENMPHVKVIFTRDSPTEEDLNKDRKL